MIATIGEAHDLGWKLRVYCREGKGSAMKKHRACTAYVDADLETLVWTRGRDFPISRLDSRMKPTRPTTPGSATAAARDSTAWSRTTNRARFSHSPP